MANPKIQGKNQFGEEIVFTLLQTPTSLQTLSTAMPAKSGVTAVAAVSPGTVAAITTVDNTKASIDAALALVVAQIQLNRTALNAIIAALKATT